MKRLAFATLGVLTVAAAAYAAPGDVISSFDPNCMFALGAYRSSEYVYVIDFTGLPVTRVEVFTPDGNYVGEISFAGGPPGRLPEDPDASYMGASYVTIAMETGIGTWALTGGYVTEWRHGGFSETVGYAYNPGSPYYFIRVWPDKGDDYVCRFTTAGSFVGSFATAYGWKLAAVDRFNGVPGDYLISVGSTSGVYTTLGSLVATFNMRPSLYGCSAGPGYPAENGLTLWGAHDGGMVYQVDLGNGTATALIPASVGRIKALFR